MSQDSNIIIDQTPVQENFRRVDFVKDNFETIIQQKGYNVHHERALKCPCRTADNDSLSTCQNCGGTRWLFINKIKTKMLLHSMDIQKKYREWSEETVGKVIVTARDVDKLAFMDRITLLDAETIHSQLLFYKEVFKGKLVAFPIYDVKEIIDAFMFSAPNEKLRRLTLGEDYAFENNKFILANKYKNFALPLTVSIRYLHAPQFHMISMSREAMNTEVEDETGKRVSVKMPVSGIANRSHHILDRNNFVGDYIFDNSYDNSHC